MATIAGAPIATGGDDRFFIVSAVVMAVVVAAGFSLHLAMGRSSFAAPPLVHVHAIVFIGWVALYVAQAALAGNGARGLHRTLGWIGAAWAAVMVVLGIALTVMMVRRGATPFFFQPIYFLVMNPLVVLTFAGLTGAAIALRRRTAWHRRLHHCAMAALLAPAVGRLLPMPFLIPHAGEAVFAALLLFPIAGVAADLMRRGRVHRAWWWGIGTMVAMQVAINAIAFSATGDALYRAVAAGSPGAAVEGRAFPAPPPMP